MKKLSKHICMILAASVATAITLSACSQPSPSASAPSGSSSASASAPASDASPASAAPITITYNGPDEWAKSQLQTTKGGYDKLVSAFEAANPGVKVKITSDPWATWQQKLPVLIASGNAPDVFMANNPDVPAFLNGGLVHDLSDLPADYFKQFFTGPMSMYQLNGKIAALPFTTDCRVLWYNKDAFTAAGLDPNKPPTTWDELKADALKCNGVTVDGVKVAGYGSYLGVAGTIPDGSLYCTTGSYLLNKDTMAPNVDTPEFRGFLKLMSDISPAFEPDATTLTHENVATLFGQKKIAITIAGGWMWSVNPGLQDQNWYGMALVPKIDANSQGGSESGGWAVCVSSKSQHIAEAEKFAQAMCDPSINALLHTDVPATAAGAAICDFYNNNPKNSVFKEQIATGRQEFPKTVYDAQLVEATRQVYLKAVLKKETVDQAVAELTNNINKIVKP